LLTPESFLVHESSHILAKLSAALFCGTSEIQMSSPWVDSERHSENLRYIEVGRFAEQKGPLFSKKESPKIRLALIEELKRIEREA
jgi:hypothetical protein